MSRPWWSKSFSVLGCIVAAVPNVLAAMGHMPNEATVQSLTVVGAAIFGIGQRRQQQKAKTVP